MGAYLEQARLLVEKIQKIVGIFRYSRSETVTAVLAVLCFSAATLGSAMSSLRPFPRSSAHAGANVLSDPSSPGVTPA
jgi:hypothetical protein